MSSNHQKQSEELEQELPETEQTPPAEEETSEETAKPQEEKPAEEAAPEKSEAEQLQEKIDELNDRLLRTMAEYDNFRKRSQREKEAIYPQATASAVAKFVPVIDTVERALEAPCNDAEYKKGVEMILQNFKDILQKMGVEEFGAAGEQFSPDLHNAVMHVEDEELEANVITDVFQKGYKLGDRIIRHAMVKVAN